MLTIIYYFKDSKNLQLNNIIVVVFMDLGTRVRNVFKIVFTISITHQHHDSPPKGKPRNKRINGTNMKV